MDTNLDAVELRVGGIDLGLGDIARLDRAQRATIGRSTGCLDSAVTFISLDAIDATGGSATFTVDYGSHGDGETLTVHHRRYEEGQTPGEGVAGTVDLTVPASGALTANVDYTGLETGVRQYVEASTSGDFPHQATTSVSFVPEESEVFVVTVVEELPHEEFHLAADTGVGLVGCHEGEDVLVALYTADGEELESYVVDVLPAGPVPDAPNGVPVFSSTYYARHVCVDRAGSRTDYFDGGEGLQGGSVVATDPDSDTLEYSLAVFGESLDYAYFDVNAATGEISVSRIGADNEAGLDAEPALLLRGGGGRR